MSDLQREIEARIVGKRVVSANLDILKLDDGTVLRLWESAQDCCAVAGGTWEILDPNSLEAAITSVTVEQEDGESYADEVTNFAKITILHNQNKIALADCSADNGNGGYYFSVLSLNVEIPGAEAFSADVVSA